MPKMTVLDMVQSILNDGDSDEINSLNDTIEAYQVATLLRDTYFEIINARDWDFCKELFKLTASGDSDLPCTMTIPDNVSEVYWIKYNKLESGDTKDKWSEVTYLEPDEFINKVHERDSSATDITTMVVDGHNIYVYNDRAPTYYTSFDDETLVFDAYDTEVDTTLQESKTNCYGYREPTFTIADTFIPDLPTKAFPFYLSEAKSTYFNNIKQLPNAKEEQKSRRQRYKLSRDKRRSEGSPIKYPNYGRK